MQPSYPETEDSGHWEVRDQGGSNDEKGDDHCCAARPPLVPWTVLPTGGRLTILLGTDSLKWQF